MTEKETGRKKTGAIFDVDGTLLDSMGIWEDVGVRYVKNLGKTPEEHLGEILFPMSLEEGAAYVKEHYDVPFALDEIIKGVLGIVRDYYYEEAPLKDGAKELLEVLNRAGVPMVIATSGEREHVERAFARLGIDRYFETIFTCSEVGQGKSSPLIYRRAAEALGMSPGEIWVFEDALHALRTAKGEGFHTVAVYDEASEKDQDALKTEAEIYVKSLRELSLTERKYQSMRTALTIAGSDSSGGAGIQADIKTMISNGVYAMSAITALTAQNTTGVTGIMEVTPEFLGEQLDCIFADIYPDAVKIGMVSASPLIEMIADKLTQYGAKNIVVDPVMVATSGSKLISDEAIDTLKARLLKMACVLTPNIPEAEVLSGMEIKSADDMIKAAEVISGTYRCAVLLKGGHKLNDANDLLYRDGSYKWFCGKRIDNPNTHGTGCTLSSAIASNLAKGYDLDTSVERAKEYISGALGAMLALGKGSGPMDHGFDIKGRFSDMN